MTKTLQSQLDLIQHHKDAMETISQELDALLALQVCDRFQRERACELYSFSRKHAIEIERACSRIKSLY